MIKRLITALTAILGVSIISYMYFNSSMLTTLNAQSAPTFQIPKGAKVVLGKYTGREIVWDIGNNANDYVLMSSKPIVDSIAIYDPSLPEITSPVAIEDRNKYCLRYFSKIIVLIFDLIKKKDNKIKQFVIKEKDCITVQ